MTQQIPAGWYPDSFRRHEHRYWDGFQWTHHVASRGLQGIDPVPVTPPPPPAAPAQTLPPLAPLAQSTPFSSAPAKPAAPNKKVQQQLRSIGVAPPGQRGDPRLFTEQVLVVNQKGKLFEVNAEYTVFDREGRQIGAVREVGQSVMKAALASANRTRRLQVTDANGGLLLSLTQPTKIINSKMIVMGADGAQIGLIARKFSLSLTTFRLEAEGATVGSIISESGTRKDFRIQDAAGNEIGRITRTSAGLVKNLVTKADHYTVEIHKPQQEPLRSLLVAAALAVDTALLQS